jgi:hypothetical protein
MFDIPTAPPVDQEFWSLRTDRSMGRFISLALCLAAAVSRRDRDGDPHGDPVGFG